MDDTADDLLSAPARSASNIPEYSVSEISGAIKRTLEGSFGRVRVRGELTEVKRYASGHIYLSLKDENGKIAGVIWKSAVGRLGLQPENGVEVIATGRITAYADRSSYQLMIDRLEYAGAGALLARIEALRVRLAAEGLFDSARKQAIPRLPGLVGVVTSAQGAVLQDIRTTIARRFARPILLWPVPVQGEGAAQKIAAAIAGLAALPVRGAVRRPDVIIVARGGGSLEDLMAFNEEVVLRAVAACGVPLISAVGHETDTTLIDYVSDRRAPTPTAAAEMAVPVRHELLADLTHTGARLMGALNQLANRCRLDLHRAERGLPDLPSLANFARQRLDDRAGRLVQALPGRLMLARRAAQDAARRLEVAMPLLTHRARAAIDLRGSQLRGALRHAVAARHTQAARVLSRLTEAPLRARLREAAARVAGCGAHLDAVSYRSVLERGYALVSDTKGHPLTRAADVPKGARLSLQFADGSVGARADGSGQGSLF
jgi:exodeoxyribonuclease VII large subunit